jgi:hypothetical protein
VDAIQGPIDLEAHAHETNMLVDNNVIENVATTVTAGVLKDIHTPVCKWPSVALLPPSPILQSLSTEGTQDSLSFPLFSTANETHAPSEPTSEGQDPSDLNEMNQLQEDNNMLRKHLSEMSDHYYQWKVACILTMDRNR